MKLFSMILGLVALLLPACGALAEGLTWDSIRASGWGVDVKCQADPSHPELADVGWTTYGNELSIVFRHFGVRLEKAPVFAGRPLSRSGRCKVEAFVTIPRGHYIATMEQTISAALLKDKGTTGAVASSGVIFNDTIPLNQVLLTFGTNERYDATAAPIVKNRTQVFDARSISIQCGFTRLSPLRTNFKIDIAVSGARMLPMQNFVLNVDANDMSFDLHPTLERCPN